MKAMVTGGGGFLGGAIVRRLIKEGHQVRSFARGDYPHLAKLGVDVVRGDLGDAEAVDRACVGMDIVFHSGAKAGVWGRYEDYHLANVDGTKNVIESCRRHAVGKLVYTSSPSVVFNGRDLEGIDESAPIPAHFEAHYPTTKAIAERLALAADGPELSVTALRPHLIWGPGDNHLFPRIVARFKEGRLYRISGPPKLVDSVYIDNAVDAHMLAAAKLGPGAACAGKAYFIAQGEPMPLWDLVDGMLKAAGLGQVTKTMSPRAAYNIGWALEVVYGALGMDREPPLTRYVAGELSTAHWFDLTAAKRDLGYKPGVSTAEGLKRLAESLR